MSKAARWALFMAFVLVPLSIGPNMHLYQGDSYAVEFAVRWIVCGVAYGGLTYFIVWLFAKLFGKSAGARNSG